MGYNTSIHAKAKKANAAKAALRVPTSAPLFRLTPESIPVPAGYTLLESLTKFCSELRVPEGPLLGQKWELLNYQRDTLEALCDPITRRIIISIPRKGGKTAWAACLLLASVCGPLARMNSQVFSAAQSREQASLVFDLACKIIRLTPWLSDLVHIQLNAKRLMGKQTGVVYRALAAEATTAHGLSPCLVIYDELGQITGPQSNLYDALESAFGAQIMPKSLIISTQAASDGDLLSVLIDDALATKDPTTKVILYAAPSDSDPWDERTWFACHPALGAFRNLVEFREAAQRAQRMPTEEQKFRRYYLNQRVSGETGFVSASIWAANSKPVNLDLFKDGREVFAGLDLSSRQDLTAMVYVCEDDEGELQTWVRAWTPQSTIAERAERDRAPYETWVRQGHLLTTPGPAVNYQHVVQQIAIDVEGMNLVSVGYDRWRIVEFRRELEREGLELPLKECGQGYRDMSPRIEATQLLLLEGALHHGGQPVLTFAASSATVTKDPAGNMKLDKGRAFGRIDPLVATVMAVGERNKREADTSSAVPILVF